MDGSLLSMELVLRKEEKAVIVHDVILYQTSGVHVSIEGFGMGRPLTQKLKCVSNGSIFSFSIG